MVESYRILSCNPSYLFYVNCTESVWDYDFNIKFEKNEENEDFYDEMNEQLELIQYLIAKSDFYGTSNKTIKTIGKVKRLELKALKQMKAKAKPILKPSNPQIQSQPTPITNSNSNSNSNTNSKS